VADEKCLVYGLKYVFSGRRHDFWKSRRSMSFLVGTEAF